MLMVEVEEEEVVEVVVVVVVMVVIMVIVMIMVNKSHLNKGEKSELTKNATDRYLPPKSRTKHYYWKCSPLNFLSEICYGLDKIFTFLF
jgi:cell division protein FtsN